MIKKVTTLAVICSLALMIAMPVYANISISSGSPSVLADIQNSGVGYKAPIAEFRSIYRPSEVWNINEKGAYNFSGSAQGSTLYTNYKFRGKTSYNISVQNSSNKTLKVINHGGKGSINVKPNESASFTVTTKDNTHTFYLSFSGPSNFNGTIK